LEERLGNVVSLGVTKIRKGHQATERLDELATEEPMEIRVLTYQDGQWSKHQVAVAMRTPGHDFELSAGFLLSEGVVKNRRDIMKISYCTDPGEVQQYNIVNVYLAENVQFDEERLSRHVYTTSSCGICGKGALDQVRTLCDTIVTARVKISDLLITSLPSKMRPSQSIFSRTGGLHASALFDLAGNLLVLREDVGRHNALDKLIGSLLLSGRLPASESILLLSGRAGFELIQKAAIAGIPIVCSVGGPTNLAVDLAREYGITLVGFLRQDGFNLYSAGERISVSQDAREVD